MTRACIRGKAIAATCPEPKTTFKTRSLPLSCIFLVPVFGLPNHCQFGARSHLYKAELIHKQGPWRGLDDVEFETLSYVDWFNQRRLHGEIGMVPPAEFEAAHYAKLAPTAATADAHDAAGGDAAVEIAG